MEVIYGRQLQKDIVGERLFHIERLSLKAGQKVGLVGENGAGKSTLLRLMIGEDETYSGHVEVNGDWAYVPQLKETSLLSGGEQVLSLIKQALAQKTSLLLLDEPTAHLDYHNSQWLLHQLKKYRGALLVVSHDRSFLDELVEEVWYLGEGSLHRYRGNYTSALQERRHERDQAFEAHTQYQHQVKKLQRAVEEKRRKAQKMVKKKRSIGISDWKVRSQTGSYDSKVKGVVKAAKSLEKRMERLEKVQQPRSLSWARLEAKGYADGGAHGLFRLNAASLAIQDTPLFSYPDLSLTLGDKVAIRGRNGSGKTTFLRGIVERSLSGSYSPQLAIGYFAQDLSSQLERTKIGLDLVAESSQQSQDTLFSVLAMLGLPYQKALQPVGSLSGGERVRLLLAKVLLSDNQLLVLDEPGNFLDIVAREALENFLRTYPGSVLLVSHDQALVEAVADRVYAIEEGHLKWID